MLICYLGLTANIHVSGAKKTIKDQGGFSGQKVNTRSLPTKIINNTSSPLVFSRSMDGRKQCRQQKQITHFYTKTNKSIEKLLNRRPRVTSRIPMFIYET